MASIPIYLLLSETVWKTSNLTHANQKLLFDSMWYPSDLDESIGTLKGTMQDHVQARMGPRGERRDYRCDLRCGSLKAERRSGACKAAIRAGRVHVVLIVDSIMWFGSVLATIVSLLETNGGRCAFSGAFHFHLIAPERECKLLKAKLKGDSRKSSLGGAITLHALAVDKNATAGPAQTATSGDMTEAARLNRPSNFARFEVRVFPP